MTACSRSKLLVQGVKLLANTETSEGIFQRARQISAHQSSDWGSTSFSLRLQSILIIGLVFACGLPGCTGSKRPPITDKVPLTHVAGTVLVDGVPTAGVHIQYVPQGEIAEKRERYLNRFFLLTGEGGTFSLSTYHHGDGIPAGEYVLEFKWVEQFLSGEEDRLGGRYSNVRSPFMKIQVEEHQELDLGEIELKTDAETRKSAVLK